MARKSPIEALLSANQVRLLRVLLEDPRERWTVSELAAYFDVSPSSFQRQLRTFTDCGLLTQHREGREVRYTVDVKSVLYGPLRGLLGFRKKRKKRRAEGEGGEGLCVLCKDRPSRMCEACLSRMNREAGKGAREMVLSSERARIGAVLNALERESLLKGNAYDRLWKALQG